MDAGGGGGRVGLRPLERVRLGGGLARTGARGAARAAPWRPGGAGEATLEALLAANPQQQGQLATGWTVPLLRAELERAGHRVGEHTVRRQLHRSGWRWKRPKYVLGRPDPAYAEKNGRSPSGRRTS